MHARNGHSMAEIARKLLLIVFNPLPSGVAPALARERRNSPRQEMRRQRRLCSEMYSQVQATHINVSYNHDRNLIFIHTLILRCPRVKQIAKHHFRLILFAIVYCYSISIAIAQTDQNNIPIENRFRRHNFCLYSIRARLSFARTSHRAPVYCITTRAIKCR